MKLDQLFKYLGLISLLITGLLIIGGVISMYTGEFLNVKRFSNFFWFANTFALFGILSILTFMALGKKD